MQAFTLDRYARENRRLHEILICCCFAVDNLKEVKSKYNITHRRFRLGRECRRAFLNNRGFVSVRKIQKLIRESSEAQMKEKMKALVRDHVEAMKIFRRSGLLTADDYLKYRVCPIAQLWLNLGGAFRYPEMMRRFQRREAIRGTNEFGSAQRLLERDQRAYAEFLRRRQAGQERARQEQPVQQEDQQQEAPPWQKNVISSFGNTSDSEF